VRGPLQGVKKETEEGEKNREMEMEHLRARDAFQTNRAWNNVHQTCGGSR